MGRCGVLPHQGSTAADGRQTSTGLSAVPSNRCGDGEGVLCCAVLCWAQPGMWAFALAVGMLSLQSWCAKGPYGMVSGTAADEPWLRGCHADVLTCPGMHLPLCLCPSVPCPSVSAHLNLCTLMQAPVPSRLWQTRLLPNLTPSGLLLSLSSCWRMWWCWQGSQTSSWG
jgi:hypothetical protein